MPRYKRTRSVHDMVVPQSKRQCRRVRISIVCDDVIVLLYQHMSVREALVFSATSKRHRRLFFRFCEMVGAARSWRLIMWAFRFRHVKVLNTFSTAVLRAQNIWFLHDMLKLAVLYKTPLNIFERLLKADRRVRLVHFARHALPNTPHPTHLRCGCILRPQWWHTLHSCHIHCTQLNYISFYALLLQRGSVAMILHYYKVCHDKQSYQTPTATFIEHMLQAKRLDVLQAIGWDGTFNRSRVYPDGLCGSLPVDPGVSTE